MSARALGYRLIGSRLDYLLHLRPIEWPVMAAHTTIGCILAVASLAAVVPVPWVPCLLGVTLWVVFLNGGTLAINSAFDRDEGDIGYLRRPPPPPPYLFAWGLGLMLVGLAAALLALPIAYGGAYAACVVLSILYSAPPARLKAVAGADWAINLVGFGVLTPLAGWFATGAPLTRWGVLVLAGFGLLFAALYPLTQLYQLDEDRARGDRTLAMLLGARRSLGIALIATLGAFACFAGAGVVRGWALLDWHWTTLASALLAWLLVLVPWFRRAKTWPAAAQQRGMYLALAAWAVTDVAIALNWLRWP